MKFDCFFSTKREIREAHVCTMYVHKITRARPADSPVAREASISCLNSSWSSSIAKCTFDANHAQNSHLPNCRKKRRMVSSLRVPLAAKVEITKLDNYISLTGSEPAALCTHLLIIMIAKLHFAKLLHLAT